MATEFIQKQITENPVVVFSKTYCPYCKMAKSCLDEIGVKYVVIELDGRDDCEVLQDILKKMTGARSVPRVFVGGKCIGGGTDVRDLKEQGKLKKLCQDANAQFK